MVLIEREPDPIKRFLRAKAFGHVTVADVIVLLGIIVMALCMAGILK